MSSSASTQTAQIRISDSYVLIGREGNICAVGVFGCVMEAEQENVLWSWMAENKRRGERWGIEARGRWRSGITWGDGAGEQADSK